MAVAIFSKSGLMRVAWAKFRECPGLVTFAECLRRAWRAVKFDLVMRATLAVLPAFKPAPVNAGAFDIRCSHYVSRKAFGLTLLSA